MSLWAFLAGCCSHPSGVLPALIASFSSLVLLGHRYNCGVNDLSTARNVALGLEMLAEAFEQLVDQPGLRQRLAKFRNDGEAVACDENRLTVTRFGGPPELGSNEQIFGVKEQILGRDWSDRHTPLRPGGIGIFCTRAPVVVAPPPTDAQVIAGTILGIACMAINASMYRRHW